LVLAMAVGMHGAGLATLVLASAWSVGEVAPPEQHVMFMAPLDVTHLVFEQPERRAVPPPATPPAAPPTPHNDPAPAQPVTPQATQPPTVPNDTPAASPPDDTPIAEGEAPPSSGPNTGSGPAVGDGPPGTGSGDGEIAQALDARMTRPEILFRVTPRYTEAARIGHRQGVVIVQATIDRTGHVTDVRLMKGLGLGLDESATNAVQQWRFKPATLGGRPVPVYFQLSVNFTIR